MTNPLSHFDEDGRPRMVDVSDKSDSVRIAIASGRVSFSPDAYEKIRREGVKKGDILRIAEIAGVMGAKKTPDLIPLCHPLTLESVNVAAAFDDETQSIMVTARVKMTGKTGVEMEALTAVSTAALTIYDMLKAAEKGMRIEGIRLLSKTGGKSGSWIAP